MGGVPGLLQRWRPRSIRARLSLSLLALLGASALLLGGITYRSTLREAEALFDYQLRQMALSLRDQGEIAPDQAAAFNDEDLDFVVQIWQFDGRIVYASRRHTSLPSRAVLGLADIRAAGGQRWRSFAVAARGRVIQVAQPLSIRSGLAANAALRSVLPLLATAPLLAAALGWLIARALQPLRRVTAQLAQRDAATLAPLPLDERQPLPDEVAPLVAELNQLLARLGQALDSQRAFVADAAHELRSPLTALKLQAQLLRRARDEADRAHALGALEAGVDRASRLVAQLLALARSEPGAAPAPAQPLDPVQLARQTLADAAPQAQALGSTLTLEAGAVPAGATLAGDADLLAVLLRNLVDNALRYSPPGSQVRLSLLPPAAIADRAGAAAMPEAAGGIGGASQPRSPPLWPGTAPARSSADSAADAPAVLSTPSPTPSPTPSLTMPPAESPAMTPPPTGPTPASTSAAAPAGPAWQLIVDDSGPGIAAAERERVFQRFVRGAAGSGGSSGSGLGLAIVRSIAQRHGGAVALGDAPLGGLRVCVTLPQRLP